MSSVPCVVFFFDIRLWNVPAIYFTSSQPVHAPVLPVGCAALLIPRSSLATHRYSECALATNNWASGNKIGEGGFGPVYRGVLHGQAVAIKILGQDSHQGHLEFARELDVLSKVRGRRVLRMQFLRRKCEWYIRVGF